MSKLVVNGAGRKGSVGATGSEQNGARASHSPPLRSHDQPTAPFLFFFSFPFLLKEFPTIWRARTSAVTLRREVARLPLAVAMSLPIEPPSAGRACSSCCGNVPPMAPHCCPALLFSLPPSLMSGHKLLKENLLLFPGLGAQLSRSLGIRRAGLGPFEDY